MPEKTFCPNCGTVFFPGDEFCSSCGDRIPKTPSPPAPAPRYEPAIVSAAQIAEYRSYIQIIGIVEIVGGVLALIGGLFLGLFAIFIPDIMSSTPESPTTTGPESTTMDFPAEEFVMIMFFMLAVLLFIYAGASIAFGKQLLEYRKSGRTGTMIIGAISLINIPLGTIFGIAALYILSKPEVEELFS
ncbi:MAG: hypothetical protein ACXADX_19400 [Candidatus Hodarchaeales archaeon]